MNRFPPDYDPKFYTFTATLLGFIFLDEFTANEQNALGNWFMLIGQVMETNSAFQQITEERIPGNTININRKDYKNGESPYMKNKYIHKHPFDQNEDIERIDKAIKIMQKEIDQLKKQI